MSSKLKEKIKELEESGTSARMVLRVFYSYLIIPLQNIRLQCVNMKLVPIMEIRKFCHGVNLHRFIN